MENLLEKVKNDLKEKGFKLTLQRQKILDVIIKNQHKHLTTEEIYMIIRKEYPEIGLATVYRTMQLLDQNNIVCKFDFDEDGIRYEFIEPGNEHQHPHFICKECGKVYPIREVMLNLVKSKIEKKYDLKITNYSLKFYGVCANCNKELLEK